MELRLLRSYVAVAELEHLGRAAARLHVSASPLSRQIRALEESLGLTLFLRERQRLALTDEGRWFLERARQLIADAERLARDTRDRAAGRAGAVGVGYVSAAIWSDILPKALHAFQRTHASVRVELRHLSSVRQIEAIRAGRVDVGFVHTVGDEPGVVSVRVLEEPLRVAIPRRHALARKSLIGLSDLAGLRWIVLGRESAPRPHDQLRAIEPALGMDIVCEVSDLGTIVRLVECGLGVAVLPDGARRLGSKDVVFREASWLGHTATLYLVTRATGRSPAAEALAALVEPAVTAGASPALRPETTRRRAVSES